MAKYTNMLKKVFLLLLCTFIYSQADEPNKFEAGNEWGWGSATTTKQAEPTDKKPVEIPYFDQDIGQHLLKKDFKYIANPSSVQESFTRSFNVHKKVFGRNTYFGYTHEEFYENIYTYLASDAWEEDLKKLPTGDAAFVRLIVYYCFTGIEGNSEGKRYIQIQLGKIENDRQREFLEEFFKVKRQRDVLRTGHWNLFFGFGGNYFSHGADDKLNAGPAFDLGFGYCFVGRYCTDFRIGSIVGVNPYKEDVVQSGVSYPKEDISYTAVEALLRAKLIYTYDYELSVFGGLRLHAIEFDTKEGERFKDRGLKDMANGYSYGYTLGFEGAKFFGGNGAIPKLFGIGARVGVANFGDNILDIGGYNWYGGIDLIAKLIKLHF